MAYDLHKNFVFSTVATAPSPATSGTSLVVAAGQGASFPTVPFNATLFPVGTQPLSTNAEIVRVTAVSTDTLTIVRAQESSTAQSVAIGFNIMVAPTTKTFTDIEGFAPQDGWIALPAITFVSSDNPTSVFSIASDMTAILQAGMRIKLTDTTVKFFIITNVSTFSGGITTITVYGGTDFTMSGSAMTLPFYSMFKAPFGFNLDPNKWSVTVTDQTTRTQTSPTASTWYNVGTTNAQISIPIGSWLVSYQVIGFFVDSSLTGTADTAYNVTLSTANNSESDKDLSGYMEFEGTVTAVAPVLRTTFNKSKFITVASKTLYFLNCQTFGTTIANMGYYNANGSMILRATSGYL